MIRWNAIVLFSLLQAGVFSVWGEPSSLLETLSRPPNFETHRVSSHDKTGGNADWIEIEPGETKVLAEIDGPGAIAHIWNTIDAEKYYSRMLILRFYWDGQETPSVEIPLGDFFAVGHGLNRAFQSFPVNASSEGRARNCYWYMPFQKSAKVTVTHEGFYKVPKFYYYIDYRTYATLPKDILYFHAQYRQAVPNAAVELKGKNPDGKTNYVLLETTGKGQYVGSVVSVQTNKDGWFGEGDDMFFVDGSETPAPIGTGTEDYFNDAWGFREFSYPYHGVTLWEGYKKGDRGTAYKWHVFDSVAFQTSLKATMEHGHANDRRDDWYSAAFWYQTLPSPTVPVLPGVFERLPDEGQLYAKRLFLNKELSLRVQQNQFEDAIKRIDEYLIEEVNADAYGYWSLRKALLLKQTGDLERAEEFLLEALGKSDAQDPKGVERDAGNVRWLAEREHPVLERRRTARIYAACGGSFELFVDGESVMKGRGWDSLVEKEINLSRGKHLIAVSVEKPTSKTGVFVELSHRSGVDSTDSTWKVSTAAPEGWGKIAFDDSLWENAVEAGRPGDPEWLSLRRMYHFVSDFLTAKFIWSPARINDDQTVYFRKLVEVK